MKPHIASVANHHYNIAGLERDAFLIDFFALEGTNEETSAAWEADFAAKWAHLEVENPSVEDAEALGANGRSKAMNAKLEEIKAKMKKQ